jgi:hypothetical protein
MTGYGLDKAPKWVVATYSGYDDKPLPLVYVVVGREVVTSNRQVR